MKGSKGSNPFFSAKPRIRAHLAPFLRVSDSVTYAVVCARRPRTCKNTICALLLGLVPNSRGTRTGRTTNPYPKFRFTLVLRPVFQFVLRLALVRRSAATPLVYGKHTRQRQIKNFTIKLNIKTVHNKKLEHILIAIHHNSFAKINF